MKNIYIFIVVIFSFSVKAQILNAYAKVTAVNGSNTTLSVNNVNQTYHTFSVGEEIIIMQMQDDVIGGNTGDVATFGNLSSIANAGKYETAVIASRTPTTGIPTSITLSSALTTTYNLGPNSSVQIISYRNLGASYTTTANITGLAWDGNVGGVIALLITNTLTLNHSINADGIGFIGGTRSANSGGPVCTAANSSTYRANNNNHGRKGEGIYKNSSAVYNNSRGRLLSGGGGGNDHNAGGGGGGNYTSGGNGGNGYNNCTTYPGGGLGGIPLSSYISGTRIFMGGGAGGGQQNNSVGSAGGNGGGIILLKATTLLTNTICSSAIKISANGQTAANTGNDGSGGGGAAGSIILQVTNFSNNAACPLTISANGGDGGDVTDGAAHAGGGGGGQGVIMFSITQPTLNVVTTATNGAPGNDNIGGSITAGPGGGTNNSGIMPAISSGLPVELISFSGTNEATHNSINWKSAVEINFKQYELENSEDGINFSKIATITPIGNTSSFNNYNYLDFNLYKPITYYRLKMVDLDYTFEYSPIISIEDGSNKLQTCIVYPNPASNELFVKLSVPTEKNAFIDIKDIVGRTIYEQKIDLTPGADNTYINISDFASGTYIVSITAGNSLTENIKINISNKN